MDGAFSLFFISIYNNFIFKKLFFISLLFLHIGSA